MSETDKKNNHNASHHSISFTVGDENVRRWLKLQENTSLSLRLILLNVIKQVGYMDYVTYLGLHTNVIPVNDKQMAEQSKAPIDTPAAKLDNEQEPTKKEAPENENINYLGLDATAKEQIDDE